MDLVTTKSDQAITSRYEKHIINATRAVNSTIECLSYRPDLVDNQTFKPVNYEVIDKLWRVCKQLKEIGERVVVKPVEI